MDTPVAAANYTGTGEKGSVSQANTKNTDNLSTRSNHSNNTHKAADADGDF